MITKRLKKFLDREKIHYEIVVHPVKFTSQEIAAAEHVTGKEVAKPVMVKAGEEDVMVVIPANRKVDLLKLSTVLDFHDLKVEEEKDFAKLFPDCEAGAMPPLGRLYNIPCYVDKSLLAEDEIYFNGGSHKESIKLTTGDFRRIMNAEVGDFAVTTGVAA